MQKLSGLIGILSLLIVSCNNSNTSEEKAKPDSTSNSPVEKSQLTDLLKKIEDSSQVFILPSDKPAVILGKRGTKIKVVPDDLITESGKPLGKDIRVELKELFNQGELLRANAQTVSDGNLLVSGGAYWIEITSDGEKLILKDGRTLKTQFPKTSDKEMFLFYGQRAEDGSMNWQRANEKLQPQQRLKDAAKSEKSDKKKEESEIDSIVDYLDNTDSKEVDRATIKADEETSLVHEKFYEQIELRKMGWINCDRFLEINNKTDLAVELEPNVNLQQVSLNLLFTEINSFLSPDFDLGGRIVFQNLPTGYKARVFAFYVKERKVFVFSDNITIKKGQKLSIHFREIRENDFRQLVKEL